MKFGARRFTPGDLVSWKKRLSSSIHKVASLYTRHPTKQGWEDSRLQSYAINTWTVIAIETESDYVLVLTPEGTGWTGAEFIEKL